MVTSLGTSCARRPVPTTNQVTRTRTSARPVKRAGNDLIRACIIAERLRQYAAFDGATVCRRRRRGRCGGFWRQWMTRKVGVGAAFVVALAGLGVAQSQLERAAAAQAKAAVQAPRFEVDP